MSGESINGRASIIGRIMMESSRDGARRERAITDLMERSRHDHIVRAYLDAWIAGGFENLEMALCAMAVELSRTNKILTDQLFKTVSNSPVSYFIKQSEEL